MTGSSEKSWSWLHNVALPALVAAIEASWLSVWVSAFANDAPHGRYDLSYLAFALPFAAAAAAFGCAQRIEWPPNGSWRRIAARYAAGTLIVLVGAQLSAGVIGSLLLHGSFGAISADPWSVTGTVASDGAAMAIFVGVIAWVRGAWLGRRELTARHVRISMSISAVAFVVFFFAARLDHLASFRAEVVPAVVLALLLFPIAAGIVSLVSERAMEDHALERGRTRPSMAWLVAMTLPMFVVVAVTLLVTVGTGPAVPLASRLFHEVGRGVRAAFFGIAKLLGHPHASAAHRTKNPIAPPGSAHLPAAASHLPVWIAITAAVILGVLALGVLFGLVRALLRFRLLGRLRLRQSSLELHEEHESLFSWGHLLDQLRGLLGRLLHRRPSPTLEDVAQHAAGLELPIGGSIRDHYRRVLLALRHVGHGRDASETARELQGRLLALEVPPPADALATITSAYEHARYGGASATDEEVEQAARDSAALVNTMLWAGAPE